MTATNRTRLLFATLLSTGGFAATTAYFQATAPKVALTKAVTPIAFARSVDGVHQVMHAGSQIATTVQDGDPLFLGDKITTGDQGSMLVKFSNSAQALELDSDTNLILTQSGQAIVVDLMDGYVKSQGAGSLKVKSTDGALKDLGADTVLTKDKIAGLQVIDANAQKKPASAQGVVWTYPQGDITTELNPDDPTSTRFMWEGSKADQKIGIEWGETRKTTDAHKKEVDGTSHVLDAVFPIGRHYWRWIVKNAIDDRILYSSPPQQIVVQGVFPPVLSAPTMGQKVYLNTLGDKITFKWSGQKRFDKYQILISTNKAFNQETILHKADTTASEYGLALPRYGEYFWRVAGHVIPAKEGAPDRWLRTKVFQFRTLPLQHEKTRLTWITPGGRREFIGQKPTMDLMWDAENRRAVSSFKVRVATARERLPFAAPQIVKDNRLKMTFEESGPHFAQVESYNVDSELTGVSPLLTFDLEPTPILRAPAFANDESVFNANTHGQVNLQWEHVDGAKTYIVEFKDPAGHVIKSETTQPFVSFNKLRPGRYELRLSAIDVYGRTGQISTPKIINVSNKSAVDKIKIKKVEVQ